jgi:hypothetical protein
MQNVTARRRRRNRKFDINSKRRAEIVRHARHVGAMDSDDRDRWLVAYVLHNQSAKDQVWGAMLAAEKMGGEITRAEAIAIVDEANEIPRAWGADRLAKYLGLTYQQRTLLRITATGACDLSKRQRKKQRKHGDKMRRLWARRAAGMRPQSESLSATEPWKETGMSRRTWYRKNKPRTQDGTVLSAPYLVSTADRVVPTERAVGNSSGASPRKEERGLPSKTPTACPNAADRYESLPLELRMAALCLPIPENLARAA